MGVRGLTTYINYNQDAILKKHNLCNTNLIIDGNSLCAQLYRSLNCFSAFGGDYDKFAAYTKTFIKNLRKCNINCFIIFDGCYEKRKLKTAHNRVRSKIYGASKLDPVTQGSLQIFPFLLRDVFKEVLTDLKVPYTICEFEADDEIASLARLLQCPVLSYDSDFFIYNVLYIPFNTLDSKPKPIEIDGNKTYALECKLYKVEYLFEKFGGMKKDILPLLATLLGNDFVEKSVFRKFFSQLKLPKGRKTTNEQQRCIHALFQWLQNETLESAISKILGRLRKNRKDKVFGIIKKSIEGYHNNTCRSIDFFDIDYEKTEDITIKISDDIEDYKVHDNDLAESDSETDSEGERDTDVEENSDEEDNFGEEENSDKENNPDEEDNCGEEEISEVELKADNEPVLISGLPSWFADGIRLKTIPQSYLNLYLHHLHFCCPQAEDYSEPDCFMCCLPILRYAFDLLTDFTQERCVYVSRDTPNSYKRLKVSKHHATSRFIDSQFSDLTEEQLKQCFHHFIKENLLNIDQSVIEELPQNFQLYMVSMLYWLAKCKVSTALVHSLLLTYTMLEVIDEKTGSFRGHYHFNNKYSKKIDEIKKNPPTVKQVDDELFLNKNKVLYEDCLIAASVLLKNFELDDSIRKKPKSYDSRRMHGFAQFQCCVQQLNHLNQLCRSPFEATKYSKCFNGTFAYNIALKLENQADPVSFIQQYLKGATTVLMFYKSLYSVYERLVKTMNLTTSTVLKKKGRKKRKGKSEIEREVDLIVKSFEFEVVI